MTTPQDRTRAELEALVAQHTAQYGDGRTARRLRSVGIRVLMDWLEQSDGTTWQARWEALGEPAADWLADAGAHTRTVRTAATMALQVLMLAGVIRPSYAWLLRTRNHRLYANLRTTVACEAFATLLAAVPTSGMSGSSVRQGLLVLGRVMVHTGTPLASLTTADLLTYGAAITATGRLAGGLRMAHQLLRQAGFLRDAPLTSSYAQRLAKATMAELVDRYEIACPEVRDLLVHYLEERAPGLDYASASQVAARLGKHFWRDIERHHPGIISLDLSPDVIGAWKARQALLADGRPRKDPHELFVVVRGFYLDLLEWAAVDPEHWGRFACPSPISAADLRAHRKALLQRRARMQERTRALAPVFPQLLDHVCLQYTTTRRLLAAAAACPEGERFVLDGRPYVRAVAARGEQQPHYGMAPLQVWPLDEPGTRPLNCYDLEEQAFWTWAVVEVLRLTGVRVEELLELTHLGLHQHTMPDGQRVLLLQIAPSKRDRERVLPVCPELAHVLAAVVRRIRQPDGSVPIVQRYDPLEKTLSKPLPYLFQRRWRLQGAVMSPATVALLLARASVQASLLSRDGAPLTVTPHDFRRQFATEAVNGGLPIHIAAKLLGHLNINTTQGYVAVYPEAVIRHYQQHLSRRRVTRPASEYQEPTADEWQAFGTHFRRRTLALGDCYRPYGTDCPHEHACVRCPMLRMDPAQAPRLLAIRDNTLHLLAEARQQQWEGEVMGLEETLRHIDEKQAQLERLAGLPPHDLVAAAGH